jgi:1,4-alpha-glucan branching enzyme
VDNPFLRYAKLRDFDTAMLELDDTYALLEDALIEQLTCDDERKLIVYRRGPLVFVVNLHPTQSYADLRIPVPDMSDYRLVLCSDDRAFGGFGNVAGGQTYICQQEPLHGREQSLLVYVPCRVALVLAPIRHDS